MAVASERSTQSATIADLLLRAADRYGDRPAVRAKRGDEWVDTSFAEVGTIVSETARGLIDLGLEPGDRVALLCTTRPEWSYLDYAISSAGGVVVPVYPTNSPEECAWVAGNSEARMVVCEDAGQAAKIAQVRGELGALEQVIVIESELDDLRARGRSRDPQEVLDRARAVRPEDPYTFIYTSGTTGPPKGCVLSHGNYRAIMDSVEAQGILGESSDDEVVYLYLPLAHAYALLIQLLCTDLGLPMAYFSGDATKIIPELGEVRPTYLPSVPRIFEKLFTLVAGQADPETITKATQVGMQVRELERAGTEVPAELRAAFDQFDAALFAKVRAIFGGRVTQATTGAAPIAKEILEFFFAAGVPVLEGYGMTETSTAATGQTPEDYRFGSVGKALPGTDVRIAEDGEILLSGPNIFGGYYKMEDASFGAVVDGWLHTGDLGRIDGDGFVFITGRKKDIIITAGGKNLTPANLENDLKQSPVISQAVMYGDRRPYPVALITLDPDAGLDPASDEAREKVQAHLDRMNAKYAQVEQIKRFAILDHDFSQETGELTPTLKVKRNVVYEQYAALFDGLYE
ncbi:MAG: AMP-dependent synthetase/ligase [Solirubrobacteraceae bacterium]